MRALLVTISIFVTLSTGAFAQSAIDGFKTDVTGSITKVKVGQGGNQGRYKYIIGGFSQINGVGRNNFARVNHDGSLDTSFAPAPDGNVYDVVAKDSQIIVTGGFSTIGGGASAGIARLSLNGVNDGTFTASISGAGAIAIQSDNKVIVGGSFTTVNGLPRLHLARFNADGTLDPTFAPNINNSVFGVALQPDGKIIITGQFDNVNGQERDYFARLNSDGTLDTAFGASLSLPGANNVTYDATVQPDGKVVIGGIFTFFGDFVNPKNGLVRLNPNGSVDQTFSPSFNGAVYDVEAQPDGKTLVGGRFTTVNGATRGHMARINMNGTVDTSFVTNTSVAVTNTESVQSFALQSDGAIVVGGDFTLINGSTTYKKLARLYPDGRTDADTVLTITGGPAATMVSLPNGQTLLGGGFTQVGGVARQGMARIGWAGGNDSTFANPQLTGWVYGIAVQSNGQYIAGGDFTSAGGGAQAKLAKINTNGTIDASFAPTFNAGGWVQAVAIQPDGKIIIAGGFTTVNGVTRTRVARLNASGSLDTTFNATADELVSVVALQSDGKILIGGAFENVGGQPHPALARLNADGTVDTSFNPTIGGIPIHEVYEITLDYNGSILVGGRFSSVNGTARSNMARLGSNGSLDAGFVGPTIDGSVLRIVPDNNHSYHIAGRFLNVGGIPTPGIAQVTDQGQVVGFPNTGANDVLAMTIRSDNKILLSGYFTTVNGQPRAQFAALRGPTASLSDLIVSSSSILWQRGAFETDVRRVVFDRSVDGVTYTPVGEGTRGLFGEWSLLVPNANATGYLRARGYTDDFSIHKSVYEKVAWIQKPAETRAAPFDFDGDGKTDLGIFRPGVAEWWINRSSNGVPFAAQFGSTTDRLAPADFTGDGKTDIAMFRPSEGKWYILRSEDSSFYSFPFGTNGDIPAPADFDNDGKADAAVFRPSNTTWYIQRSSDNGTTFQTFGANGDVPVVSDYDGDGKADIAIFRPSNGQWWISRSASTVIAYTFGSGSDKPVPGDYTGDGKSDIAIWRPTTGEWFFLRSEDNSYYLTPFGTNGDIVAPGDYDGDGKFDPTVFRPSNATWYSQRSGSATLIQQFGLSSDRPIPNAFVP